MTLTCSICTEEFLSTAEVNTTPCGHMYHRNCLSRWLEQSQTCPQCRKVCTAAQLIKMHLNGTAHSDTTSGNSDRNGWLLQKLDNLTSKIRDQELLLKTMKDDAVEHRTEQKKMSKTLKCLETQLNDRIGSLLQKLDNLTLKIRDQEQLQHRNYDDDDHYDDRNHDDDHTDDNHYEDDHYDDNHYDDYRYDDDPYDVDHYDDDYYDDDNYYHYYDT